MTSLQTGMAISVNMEKAKIKLGEVLIEIKALEEDIGPKVRHIEMLKAQTERLVGKISQMGEIKQMLEEEVKREQAEKNANPLRKAGE